jgi:hypothetical protein
MNKQILILTLLTSLFSLQISAGPVTALVLGSVTAVGGGVLMVVRYTGEAAVIGAKVVGSCIAGPAGDVVAEGITRTTQVVVQSVPDDMMVTGISTATTTMAAIGMMLPTP